jgi:hypothetical protein
MITTYMQNSGGLNLTDSPLFMQDTQATGQSYNYDYSVTGAITKVLSPTLLNTLADTQLKTLGLGQYHDVSNDGRTLIRCAGTKIQVFDPAVGSVLDVTDDTQAAGSDFLDSTSTQPVVFAPFNTVVGGTQLWMAGGGLSEVVGYEGTTVTTNGIDVPGGSITPTVNSHAGGSWTVAGTYYYGVQLRKASTQVYSNVALDVSAVIVNTDDTVTLPLTAITGIDTTLCDQVWIWRSAVSGVSGFTTGSIIAKLASTATTYTDTGSSILDTQNTPRAGNTVLDNSVLPSGTFRYITAYKRRLVTVSESTVYISDLNKPESWPTVNRITVPSGGPITGIGVIGVPSEYTTGADEYLCIWKERELWVLTGENADDWTLLFVDKTGCAGQSLVVSFNSFITWMGYNGIFIWDGRGRPSRISRPIQGLFNADGDINKGSLSQGYAAQYEKGTQIIWRVSHRTLGTNKLSIKMDTRLTALAAQENLQNPEIEGVFITDTDTHSYYAICSFKPSNHDEQLIVGDDSGYVYRLYSAANSAVSFDYETKPFDMGHPEVLKRFKRVLVYIEKLTVNDLTLYFWADYRIRETLRSKVVQTMAPTSGAIPSIWDIAVWDQNLWDDYYTDISPIEFHLHNSENNAEGISLKLRFEQLEASAPVRIHGFSIEWEPMSNLPTPTAQVG